jgi:retinol dehydrogenase-14
MADVPLMAGKCVLVTGGTGGIGQATAAGLAALGARVGITGRDQARAEVAAAGIRAAPGSPAVDVFAADLSAQAGVRQLAAAVLDSYPQLDVLVNNVGGFWAHRHLTADGLERTFAVNHLAPFLLTSLLLDRLTASAPPGSSPSPPPPTPAAASTSTTCRASGTTPGSAPTASRSWLA